ncbi:MAG: cardiolipin synthase [Mogibacterium sp.]|nr:cardiolipin synthase [Mogibacterium sp.]
MKDISSHANAEDFMRLIKPKRKNLLSLIFSRFFLFVLLMALQVFIVIMLVEYAKDHIGNYLLLERLFAFMMIVYLFSCPMDSSAKLTWMLIISIVPIVGAALLFFTQFNLGNRRVKKNITSQIIRTKHAIPQPEGVMDELHNEGDHTDDLVRYLCRSGCFPAYDDTKVTYFPSGEAKFEVMLRELAKAEKYIFMEYFIIEEGYMWGKILDVLTLKAKEGVKVRVMYDGMCEISTLTPDYFKRLSKVGIEAKPFSPIRPFLSSHYNYRDHRKILVIDGKVAFTGGVNLADEYINRIERFGHWKDVAIMVKGGAVRSFTLMFLQMWNAHKQDAVYDEYLAYTPEAAEDASGYVVPYCDCPLDDDKVGEAVYMDILNRAGTYVHIMTPYLILDGELETAIKYAAERGVDVKLILPGIPDKTVAYALAKSHYWNLLSSGVKIYEYTPGFVHAKVFVSDDIKAVVGTINLDYRSLYHHFECATYMFKTDCVEDIEKDFQQTLSQCREITKEIVKNENRFYILTGGLVRFLAPLM